MLVHAPFIDAKVLEMEWELKNKSHESPLDNFCFGLSILSKVPTHIISQKRLSKS